MIFLPNIYTSYFFPFISMALISRPVSNNRVDIMVFYFLPKLIWYFFFLTFNFTKLNVFFCFILLLQKLWLVGSLQLPFPLHRWRGLGGRPLAESEWSLLWVQGSPGHELYVR